MLCRKRMYHEVRLRLYGGLARNHAARRHKCLQRNNTLWQKRPGVEIAIENVCATVLDQQFAESVGQAFSLPRLRPQTDRFGTPLAFQPLARVQRPGIRSKVAVMIPACGILQPFALLKDLRRKYAWRNRCRHIFLALGQCRGAVVTGVVHPWHGAHPVKFAPAQCFP